MGSNSLWIDPVRLRNNVTIAITLLVAIGFGAMSGATPGLAISVVLMAVAIFGFVVAGSRWWLVIIGANFLGGIFDLGGRELLLSDVGFIVAIGALLPSLAVRRRDIFQHRPPLPHVVSVLGIYILVHFFVNYLSNRFTDIEGQITALRYHCYALWPIVFAYLYNRYGSSSSIRYALHMLVTIMLLRLILGLTNYFTGIVVEVPAIHYLPPGIGWTDSYDLRYSCPILALLASCYFSWSKNPVAKWIWALVFAVALISVMLGMGRAGLILFLLVPLWWALMHRKWLLIAVLCVLLGGCVAYLNIDKTFYRNLPDKVKRTLAVLVFTDTGPENEDDLKSSNYWHQRLRQIAVDRWTTNLHTFAFGTGIYRLPFDKDLANFVTTPMWFENRMQVAARSGAYETGILGVLAVQGLAGLMIYAAVLLYLARSLMCRVWKEGVCDAPHAFAYVAAFQIFVWSTLSWTFGNVPSTEIFLGLVALIALQDGDRARSKAEPPPSLAGRQPAIHTNMDKRRRGTFPIRFNYRV